MSEIDEIGPLPRDGRMQFALPLFRLVPGSDQIQLSGINGHGAVAKLFILHVSG